MKTQKTIQFRPNIGNGSFSDHHRRQTHQIQCWLKNSIDNYHWKLSMAGT
jgi:hypothetical protein